MTNPDDKAWRCVLLLVKHLGARWILACCLRGVVSVAEAEALDVNEMARSVRMVLRTHRREAA